MFTMEYAPAPKDVAYDDLLGSPQRRQDVRAGFMFMDAEAILHHFLGFRKGSLGSERGPLCSGLP